MRLGTKRLRISYSVKREFMLKGMRALDRLKGHI